MDTSEFLAAILPASGKHFFVVEVTSEGRILHSPAYSIEKAASYALKINRTPGSNAYYAMASFKEAKYIDSKGRTKRRTQENVDKVKCFWLDLDVKGKGDGSDYASQKDALADLQRFRNETQFPKPSIVVSSGYGIHAYWILDEEISGADWTLIANSFRKLLDAHAVKHDSSCTTDSARILRPIGTYNRKAGLPDQEVVVLGGDFVPIPLQIFTNAVDLEQTTITPLVASPAGEDMSLNVMAEGMVEFQPSSIKEIVKECALLRAVGTCGGDVSEPLWYSALGVVQFTIEHEKAIHVFSKGYAGYTQEETIAKAAQWEEEAGPSSCELLKNRSMAEMPEHCAGCKHFGKITSPIVLGYPKTILTEKIISINAVPIHEMTDIPAFPIDMQHSYKWDEEKLWKKVLDKDASKDSGSTVYMWESFSHLLFYPYSYYNDLLGHHHMVWRLREREGIYKEFELSGSALGTGGIALFKELGEHGIIAINGKKALMEAYILHHFSNLRKSQIGSETYCHLGWHGKDFLLNDTLYKPDGTTKKVKLGGNLRTLADDKSKPFTPRGNVDRWVELIDQIYNRPGNEQYQFIIGAGFGSILIEFMNVAGGLTISTYSGHTGQGKTTAARQAFGIYGCPFENTPVTLSKSSTTFAAIFNLAGTLHSLPLVVDEMTGVQGLDASNTVYTFSQGQPRQRSMQNGSIQPTGFGWSSLMFATGQAPLTGVITGVKPAADAEIARMIEFQCVNKHRMPKHEADIVFAELKDNFAVAGPVYVQYVVTHLDEVIDLVKTVQQKLDVKYNFKAENRFWSAGYACAIAGLYIAQRLGLIRFNIKGVIDWCSSQLISMHAGIQSFTSTPEDCFSSMLHSLAPGFVVTDIEGGRGTGAKQAYVEHEPRGTYTGRLILDDKRGLITQPAVHNWCGERQIDVKEMMAAAFDLGWIRSPIPSKHYPGKGTHFTMGQCRCYELDLSKLEASAHLAPILADVVQLVHKDVAKK